MNTIENLQTSNFGGIVEKVSIYDVRDVVRVRHPDSSYKSIVEILEGSTPFFVPFTKDSVEYSLKTSEKDGIGEFFSIEVTGSVPKIRGEASARIENLQKKRFVMICSPKSGGSLVLGDADKPLQMLVEHNISADIKSNSYTLKFQGISLSQPPFLASIVSLK